VTDRRNQLAGVNLNLFPVLDAMLRHQSVTRAAQELGVTPSAVSHSLRELRALLDDPLFVRSGTGMAPTQRARQLELELRGALGALGEVVRRKPEFDPSTSGRTVIIATSDEVTLSLLPGVLGRVMREAPGMAINIRPRSTRSMEMLEFGELDILLKLTGDVPAWAGRAPLDTGDVVCVVRGGHPRVRGALTLEAYRELPHVRISPQGFGASATELKMRELGIDRDVVVFTYSFVTAPELIARTDAVLTMPRWVASVIAPRLGLQILESPIDIPDYTLDMVWHLGRDDPSLVWFRQVLVDALHETRAT